MAQDVGHDVKRRALSQHERRARIEWNDLPDSVRDDIQRRTGPVVKAEPVGGGIMSGLTARLHLDAASVFPKAISITHPAVQLHRWEQQNNRILPPLTPAPRMLWHGESGVWVWSAFDYIDGAHHADLAPGSTDVPAVVEAVATLGQILTPAPGPARSVLAHVNVLQDTAQRMLEDPLLPNRALFEAALDGFDVGMLRGHSMVHYDLNPGNLLVAGGYVHVIDWSFAARGAAWIDAATLVPRLIQAGHTPSEAETLLLEAAAWRFSRPTPVTGFAALWTLYRLRDAMYGPPERRGFRARAAEAARAWLKHRLDG